MRKTLQHRANVNLDDEVAAVWGATGSSVYEDIDRLHPYESSARVLEGERRAAMARLLNAWEWHERTEDGRGQGGENPHRHPDGWFNVYGPRWMDSTGHTRNGSWDFTIVVIHGPATDCWYVVKAEPVHLPAKAYQSRLAEVGIMRSIPRRMVRNPDSRSRYEQPWLWMEPLEILPAAFTDGVFLSVLDDATGPDDAIRDAKAWAAELRAAWSLEEDGWGGGEEILLSPEAIGTVRRLVEGDTGEAAIEAVESVIDAVASMLAYEESLPPISAYDEG